MSESPGGEVERRLYGEKAEAMMDMLAGLDPDVARWADEFVFGDVWTRPGLAYEERLLVAIAVLGALGRTEQLRNYLFSALKSDLSREQVQQTLAMLAVYAGFPAATSALICWRDVQASHDRRS